MVKRWVAGIIAVLWLVMCIGTQAEVLSEGARSDEVKTLQENLIALNYLQKGQADGIFGAKTSAALTAFQQANHLEATGAADEATLAALSDPSAVAAPLTLRRGDEGEEVKILQENLIRLGFLDGEADGDFGPSTQKAVKAVQAVMKTLDMDAGPSGDADPGFQACVSDDTVSLYTETLTGGSDSSDVLRVQRRLFSLGYMDEAPDGSYGEYTQDCVAAFRRDCGLSAGKDADQAVFDRLFDSDVPSAEHPVPHPLDKGDKNGSVKAVKQRLIELGFMGGIADECYNDALESGLERYQAYLGEENTPWLETTAHLSVETQEHILYDDIDVFRSEVASGSKGSETSRVQRRLYSLYYFGANGVDGKAGSGTRDAIKLFQEKCGLEPTGKADEETQRRLFSADAPTDTTDYILKVSVNDQKVYAYRLGYDGEYRLCRTMTCSTGLGDSTPYGIFRKTGPQHRWHYFTKFFCWAQYTYIIEGDIMFHSVLYSRKSESSLRTSSVYNLGHKASHGCVRLAVEDAKWIFEHCPEHTIVLISDSF